MHCSLALDLVVLFVFGVLFQNHIEGLHCVVSEIPTHLFWGAVICHVLKGCKLWLLKHFRSELLASHGMVFKILNVIINIHIVIRLEPFQHLFKVLVLLLLHQFGLFFW